MKKSHYTAKYWNPNIKEEITLYKAHFANYGFDKHVHDEYTISIIYGGVMEAFMGGCLQKVPNLNIAMLNPDEVHSNSTLKGEEYKHYSLYLKPSYVRDIVGETFTTNHVSFKSNTLEDPTLAYKLIWLLEQDDQGLMSSLEFECQLIDILNDLLIKNTKVTTFKEYRAQDDLIVRAKEFINDNYYLDLSLEDIAKELGISKYHFLRAFKSKSHLSPHAYLMVRRVEKAKQALQKGASIITTAHACGFSDQSHLHRRFKAVLGTTPKEYQQFFI